jgi:3-methyl-2-oxobutanoate hydroxymethyltransferase
LGAETLEAFKQYAAEARSGEFPAEKHAYAMVEGELSKLQALLGKAGND